MQQITEAVERVAGTLESCHESRKESSPVADRPAFNNGADFFLDMFGVPPLYRKWRLCDFLEVAPVKWDRGGVLIKGQTGTGKSCLAAALFRSRLSHNHPKTIARPSERDAGPLWTLDPGVALWRRCGEILFAARGAFKDGGQSESILIHQAAQPELFVLDDLCSGKMTDAGWTLLSEIIARRVDEMRDTIVTTNLTLEEIHTQEPRLASRLGAFEEIVLSGKDRRLSHA